MLWNDHKYMRGKHALFSPSNPCWGNYNPERAVEYIEACKAKDRGTELHELAEKMIKLKQRQRKSNDTLCQYVNDALSYRLKPEVLLYYSEVIFGTADAIGFNEDTQTLRIHDLKTGTGKVHPEQLLVYAALFCLEYHKDPYKINTELRIYQNNDKFIFNPTGAEIAKWMDQIKMLSDLGATVLEDY